mgnify:CR=1 FL=1
MGYSIENLEYITLCLWYLLGSFRYIPQFREINKPKTQDTIQKVINYMKANLDKQLTLEDMAESVNYSPTYLSTLFTQKSGMSPINYFNQLKIQKACQLLDFTDKKAKEIAFELAFNDPYYFSKVFTKYMHMSPKEYRMKKGMRKTHPFFFIRYSQNSYSNNRKLRINLYMKLLLLIIRVSLRHFCTTSFPPIM